MAQNNVTQPVTKQSIEAARGKWEDSLKHVWGGMGSWVHTGAKWVQDAAGAVMLGSAPTLAIPVVGELVEGAEGLVYAFATAIKGAVRTSAENHAIKAAGGTDNDTGGLGRLASNTIKSAVPLFEIA